ncbi:ATP-binding protein, partial [Streptomyces sp. NPDC001002]
MAQRGARSGRTLFERESELAAVDEALGALTGLRTDGGEPADRSRGALLAVAGRAGIGKTTLLAEVRRRAATRGCTVLSARGGDQEQRVAFHVARQLLQPQFAGSAEADLRASMGSWYDIVGP